MRRHVGVAIPLLMLLVSTWEGAPVRPADLPRLARLDLTPSGSDARWVIGAAGDLVCESEPNGPGEPELCQYDDTADLIVRQGLDEVLLLGDIQYEQGEFAAFTRYFDPTWGRAFSNLSPAPGNHEYAHGPSSKPTGYFRYFGDRVKGPHRLGYYSFDLGACPDDPCWHLISLSSELCLAPGGCGPAADPDAPGPGNRMFKWLTRDLARHPDAEYPCTLAYWHHPRFSFSSGSGPTTAVQPLWDLLHAAAADVVLNGHSHNYQRWRPQDPSGALDVERGIREFVVGTGGRSLYSIPGGAFPENLEVAQADSFGILRLTLKADGYRWAWVTAPGQPEFADASDGRVDCVRAVTP
ncbi:MAG: metallophosphoesterase [Actinomycetota bacterium]